MRWPAAFLITLVLFTAGCRNCDKVEAELRSRERQVEELRGQLHRMEAFNECLQREIRDSHQRTPTPATPEALPAPQDLKPKSPAIEETVSRERPAPAANPGTHVTAVVLGRQTGGWDEDRCPGDEAVQVVLEPRDPDGHALKAAGALHVVALEISPEGLKTPICSWDVRPEQLRKMWRSGLLSTGYFVVLPWKVWPQSERIRIVAQFTLADGRVFEADRDVRVLLPPPELRRPRPAIIETPVEPTVEPGLTLPLPRNLDDPAGPSSSNRRSPSTSPVQPTSSWHQTAYARSSSPVQLLRPVPLTLPDRILP